MALRKLYLSLSLTLTLVAGPALALTVTNIGLPGGPGLDGETVSVLAEDSNATGDPLEVHGNAIAGAGGDTPGAPVAAGNGGGASIQKVRGISTGGGDVTVTGLAVGGDGGDGAPGADAGEGASVLVHNRVNGSTSGNLALTQAAVGGNSGEGENGASGDATSVLQRFKSAASLFMEVISQGGSGNGGSLGAAGGEAYAEVSGSNDAGPVTMTATAYGGHSGDNHQNADGGRATSDSIAESYGDGHAVYVGSPLGDNGARGGDGGQLLPEDSGPIVGGDGGRAKDAAVGEAHGDSEVIVHSWALGGEGGDGDIAGDGGAAIACSAGSNEGEADVEVFSFAKGGNAGNLLSPDGELGEGGNALAYSIAQGDGLTNADSVAMAGRGSPGPMGMPTPGGTAQAWSRADGSEGMASALASSNGGTHASTARVSSTLAGEVTVGADVNAAMPIYDWHPDSGRSAQAFMTSDPQMNDVDTILMGHSAVQMAFENTQVIGLGSFDLAFRQKGPTMDGLMVTAEFDFDALKDLSGLKTIVGFLNPEAFNMEGFDTLRFVLEADGSVLYDELFTDPDDAVLFFDDLVINAGMIADLRIAFEATVDGICHDGFGMDLIVGLMPIPEPGTGLLLGAGFLFLALRPRSRPSV